MLAARAGWRPSRRSLPAAPMPRLRQLAAGLPEGSVSESWRNRQMLAKSGQKTALAGDWPKAIASQSWLNEGRRRGDIASASPAPMTDIANILRRNGQFSSGTSFHSVKQAPACWGLRPQSPKREASADKATAAPHVAAALCQAQGWLPRISPILNVPSPADWRNLDATAVLIARPSPKLPRGPETLPEGEGELLGTAASQAGAVAVGAAGGRCWPGQASGGSPSARRWGSPVSRPLRTQRRRRHVHRARPIGAAGQQLAEDRGAGVRCHVSMRCKR